MFGCGVMVGALLAIIATLWIATDAVDEREREIKYMHNQLASQAKKEINEKR
ncbi:MAG: hypothetical protein J6Y64_10145 [Ruminococcus sp.]|nr:hypothetical protein [Ruminococcus sp.]